MYPTTHFLYAFLVGEILVKLGLISHWIALSIGILAVLVDVDHLFDSFKKLGTINLKKAWNSTTVDRIVGRSFLHSKLSVFIITILEIFLFFLSRTIFYVIASAFYSHIILDIIESELNKNKSAPRFKFNIFGFELRYLHTEFFMDIISVAGIILLFVF